MSEFRTVNYTEVRLNLKAFCDECHNRGTIFLIQSKGRKVAMVPLRLLNELNYLRGAQNKNAVTKGEDEPRNEALPSDTIERKESDTLPAEVTSAHSRADELAAVFEQPPAFDTSNGDDDELPDEFWDDLEQNAAQEEADRQAEGEQ